MDKKKIKWKKWEFEQLENLETIHASNINTADSLMSYPDADASQLIRAAGN